MEVCLFVGNLFAVFIRDQNETFRRDTQEEAVKILEDCLGCGTCADQHACHFHAICMNEDGDITAGNYDKCIGCGVGEGVCHDESISMKRNAAKGGTS